MIPNLFTAIASSVITVFTLFRLFSEEERTFDTLFIAFSNLLWDTTATLPILIAIYISARINNTVGCLINCHWGATLSGAGAESPLTDNFVYISRFSLP